MRYLKSALNVKALFLLAAVLVGFLYIGPPLMIWKNFSASGREFVLSQYKTYRDSLQAYLPRAREIYDGHFPPSEVYGPVTALPTLQNPLPSLWFAGFIYLFRGNIDLAYLGVQFFFPAIIFLLFAFLGWQLWRSKLWAMFLGLTGVLTPIVVKLPFYKWQGWAEFQAFFLNNFIPFAKTQFDQLYLARVDEPLLTYPIYLLAIVTFFIFWRKPKILTAALAAVSAGLIFYTYFHHWVYWVVCVGLLSLYVLIFQRSNKELLRGFLVFWGVLLLITIPYFVTYLRFNHLAAARDFVWREGIVQGRTLGIGRENLPDLAAYAVLLVSSYLLYWKKDRSKAVFFFGLIGAMFIVWNLQLVIGYVPVPHFFRRSISPVIFLILFDFAHELFSRFSARSIRISKVLRVALVMAIVVLPIKKLDNIRSISGGLQPEIINYYDFPNEVAQSWSWINENLSGEPRIISPSTLTSMYLAAHTSARPFLPTAFISLLPMSDIENRYLVSHKLFGVTATDLSLRLAGAVPTGCVGYECPPDKGSNLNDSVGNIYGNYFSSRYGSFKNFIGKTEDGDAASKRSEKMDELLARYRKLTADWSSVDADYVYYGPLEKQIVTVDLSANKKLALVYKNGLVEIYKIVR